MKKKAAIPAIWDGWRAPRAELDDITEPSEDYGSAHYSVILTIGDREVIVRAWAHCGWLPPGARSDLDGRPLWLTRHSQVFLESGVWSVCDGDGEHIGRVRVIDHADPSPRDPIILGADHLDGSQITPDMVPAWAAALAAMDGAVEGSDERDHLAIAAETVREGIVEAIRRDLDRVQLQCPEPTAEEVWDALGVTAEVDGAPRVRVGRWLGCRLVAWQAAKGYDYSSWPSGAPDGAIKAARGEAAEDAAQCVRAAVAAM